MNNLIKYTSQWRTWEAKGIVEICFCACAIVVLSQIVLRSLDWWYSRNSAFEQLYHALNEYDTITALSILNRHPEYVNRFKDPEGYTPFLVACANVNTQMVQFMLRLGADVHLKSKHGETPVYLAAFYYIKNQHEKNATCLRQLYYAGANINEASKNNLNPLQLAAVFGHVSLIDWLLKKGATLDVNPHPKLLAAQQGHLKAANLIAKFANTKMIKS